MSTRTVAATIESTRALEGGGFRCAGRSRPPRLGQVDPFLLLDEMGPIDLGPGEAKGAPDHPHRGFETVTYMLDGAMEHEDSAGQRRPHRSRVDVQWMTAGAGVIHSEMPSREMQTERRPSARLPAVGEPARRRQDDGAALPGVPRRRRSRRSARTAWSSG